LNKYAFVLPRYFPGLAGGAETLCVNIARKLAERGDASIEILTTCANDNRTWDDYFAPGIVKEEGFTVRRFRREKRNLDAWIPIEICIAGGQKVTLEDELIWMKENVNSFGLYEYLAQNALTFNAVFYAPYLFGTTFWGSQIAPSNAVLIPCLHDEFYAYQSVIRTMFHTVKGCFFNCEAERQLAYRLYGQVKGGVVGMGFDPIEDDEFGSVKPYFQNEKKYILYLGRKETGKNVHHLIDFFLHYKAQYSETDLALIVAGGGDFKDLGREEIKGREDIIDIGHVSEYEKKRLIKHALCLVNPSVMESFSIVLMEAWRFRVPVVVNAFCEVTYAHTVESGGGLFFSNSEDFSAVIHELVRDAELCEKLGTAGMAYVRKEYSWKSVMTRFDRNYKQLFGSDEECYVTD
jgi:glycosyltransferase involved in cell wall biosynthesis